jgi:probable HAF family extracellular repeat protein
VVGNPANATGDAYAYGYSNGTDMLDLGTLGSTSSIGAAANDSGQAVNTAADARNPFHAFVYRNNGVMSDLGGGGGGVGTQALGISEGRRVLDHRG